MNVHPKLGLSLGRLAALSVVAAAAQAANTPTIPLCPGLTVVTAIGQVNGDYESIKTIESVKPDEIRIRYSAETPPGLLDVGPALRKVLVYRNVLTADLRDGGIYEQVYLENSAETLPGTTAIGVSAAVLKALKAKGQADLKLSNASVGAELTADRNVRPNYMDYVQPGSLKRVGSGTETVRVLVNDQPVDLPAIKAEGEFVGDKAEFYFLDDERNPLALAFRLGIGAVKPLDESTRAICDTERKKGSDPEWLAKLYHCDKANGGDHDTLRVTKISYRCSGALPPPMAGGGQPGGAGGTGVAPAPAAGSGGAGGGGSAAGGAGGASPMEQALAKNEKVDIYSIYFSFNSDVIREESEPTLHEIAQVMAHHPDWKLKINGHTDSVGGDAYNLTLSRKRSAAVMDALVKRYHIDAAHLSTDGFGRAQPKDTNDTLEGRARNRRVELMRQ